MTDLAPHPMNALARACGVLLLSTLMAPPAAWAQVPLSDLSIEQLMQMDAGRVFGASERLQPVTEAPASVTFITAQEIEQYGYRTLAEVLRSVRGMYVTNDRNFSFIGTRGFSKPGDYNSRILLLINGHRVNDNIFGQAEIGAEFGMDPALFERVEIIRGPASSLYGDSAFFAVVNVITKSGASLGGATATVEVGNLGTQLLRGSVGTRFANGVDLAAAGTLEEIDGVSRLYFPVFDSPETNNGVAEGLDGELARQAYGRLTFKGLAVTGAYGTRRRDIPTASAGTLFNQQIWREQTTDRHTLLDAEYRRTVGVTRFTFRGSYDRFSYDGTYPFEVAPDGTPTLVGDVRGVGARWTAYAGVARPLPGRQTVSAGAEYIDNLRQDQTATYIGATVPVFDIDHDSTRHAIYVQDEIKFGRWFIVNAGLRYDRYDEFLKVTPRTAFIFLPSPTQSLKYLYGSAFRAPNEYELNTTYFGESVIGLRPESIDTHELVWERYANDRLRTSVSAYWYKAEQLITTTPDESTLLGVSFVNQGEVRAKGLELEAQMRIRGDARALASYALQRAVDQQTEQRLPNSPEHVAKARISLPWPTSRSSLAFEGQYLSRRTTLSGGSVAEATTLNIHLVHPLGRSWKLVAGVRNLFDSEYLDPVSGQHLQDAVAQNGRTFRIGANWKFWAP